LVHDARHGSATAVVGTIMSRGNPALRKPLLGDTDTGRVVAPQWDHAGGLVLPHFEIAIVNDDGELEPAGTAGVLVVRAKEPGVMSDGYFGMPDKTADSWRNSWFHTGDIGRLDTDGRFYFLHRKSERIRVRGEMVSAYEVEEGALTHPWIADCAAVGVPSALGEEDIKLFVVLKPAATLSVKELQHHCARRMAKFMVPRHIAFIDEMPRTPTGKPEKGKLAKMYTRRE
jgi:crotonobetaine/carnitine-CoA ligase